MKAQKNWRYYGMFGLAVIFLSRCFAAWRGMVVEGSMGSMLQLGLFGVLFFACMIYLAFVNYQIEREKGNVFHPVRMFEKWLKS